MGSSPSEINHYDVLNRLFKRDTSLWSGDATKRAEIANRLGWLDIAVEMLPLVDDINNAVEEVRRDGLQNVVLLGMGGSSLCPAVLRQIFNVKSGYPNLYVLDTTDPDAILNLEAQIKIERTLFIISSKSGTTIEPLSQFSYFWGRFSDIGAKNPGRHFIAITDAETSLEELAKEKSFRTVFINPADIGGRYSALSYFGLVPAALIGIDIKILLERAVAMAARCREKDMENPVLNLAMLMANQTLAGIDKLTLVTSQEYKSFGLWVEQLVAESTGKEGKGVIPVIGEEPMESGYYGGDRFFVVITSAKEISDEYNFWKGQIRRAGYNLLEIRLDDPYELGGEFWRWEAAVAVCGSLMGVNPFNEPNVAESKKNTSRLLEQITSAEGLLQPAPVAKTKEVSVSIGSSLGPKIGQALAKFDGSPKIVENILEAFLSLVEPGNYLGLLAYWPENPETTETLGLIRESLQRDIKIATTVGFGPRYLHSTGQEHKGGPAGGMFIQLRAKNMTDLPIPGENYTFGQLEQAQALGDFEALDSHGRPVLAIELESLSKENLEALKQLFFGVLSLLKNWRIG